MKTPSQIAMTSDHAGYEMKQQLRKHLESKGIKVIDIGTYRPDAVDYPDYGHQLGEKIGKGEYPMGISICGTGNGINMTTNKHTGVRGAICWSGEIAEMARKHNDANICSLAARYTDLDLAKHIVDIFVSTGFEGGRHERRIRKIDL